MHLHYLDSLDCSDFYVYFYCLECRMHAKLIILMVRPSGSNNASPLFDVDFRVATSFLEDSGLTI